VKDSTERQAPSCEVIRGWGPLSVNARNIVHDSRLDRKARAVLLSIMDRVDKTTWRTWGIGRARLVRLSGQSDSTVKRALRVLERDGWIIPDRKRVTDTHNLPNEYVVCVERFESEALRAGGGVNVTPGWGQTDPRVESPRPQGGVALNPGWGHGDPQSSPVETSQASIKTVGRADILSSCDCDAKFRFADGCASCGWTPTTAQETTTRPPAVCEELGCARHAKHGARYCGMHERRRREREARRVILKRA
jgi:hypothetical protein